MRSDKQTQREYGQTAGIWTDSRSTDRHKKIHAQVDVWLDEDRADKWTDGQTDRILTDW